MGGIIPPQTPTVAGNTTLFVGITGIAKIAFSAATSKHGRAVNATTTTSTDLDLSGDVGLDSGDATCSKPRDSLSISAPNWCSADMVEGVGSVSGNHSSRVSSDVISVSADPTDGLCLKGVLRQLVLGVTCR